MTENFVKAVRAATSWERRLGCIDEAMDEPAKAVAGLAEVAFDPEEDAGFRRECVKALGRTGDSRAVGHLLKLIQDKTPEIVIAAINALGELADREATEPLIRLMLDTAGCLKTSSPLMWSKSMKDGREAVRCAAARALGDIGDPRALGPLTYVALRDPVETVRFAAASRLYKVGWNAGATPDPAGWADRVAGKIEIR